MKILKTTLATALILGGNCLFAQTPEHNTLMNDFHYVQGQIRPAGEDLGNINGSPYLREGFQKSLLYFDNSKPVEAQVRYNVVKEEMQALFDVGTFRVLHDQIVVEMEGVPLQKYSYRAEDRGVDLLGYFEVLTEDYKNKNLILLRKPLKEVKEGKKTLRMQTAFPSKYVDKFDLYIKFKNSVRAIQVENGLNKFLEAFPEEQKDRLREFIKSEKLKIRNEEDLDAIVNYYNSSF